jgi:hypothetical protein
MRGAVGTHAYAEPVNPSPTPSPVEVFVHTPPAEWWQIVAALGPLAVLLGALVAGVIGWGTLRQKAVADNRAEWWKRTQWALDAVHSGDKKRGTVGLKVLKVLAESELAGKGELAVLEAAWEKPLSDAEHSLAVHTAAVERAGEAAAAGTRQVLTSPPETRAGVDGEPGPGDNGEERTPGTAEGGRR